ncbi:MAG: HAD family hydrolase [Steroidobacteraceae bacterium]|jgi:putative hydrolase of the HAD superfamily|nr:HAD family hydrolase [Steroidobacteraceae bacterium]
MLGVRAVCLDLDDTLWPVAPAISRAEAAMMDWLSRHCPRVLERHDADSIRRLRAEVAAENPGRVHDLTFLRRAALERAIAGSGYAAALADEAFAAFFEARNRVELFGDVLPALEKLASRYRLLALSNGNADLAVIGIAQRFELAVSARDAGAAKPHPGIFELMLRRASLAPGEVVYVGDDPLADIEGARRAGLHAVWVDRLGREWPATLAPPSHRVRDLAELAALLCS